MNLEFTLNQIQCSAFSKTNPKIIHCLPNSQIYFQKNQDTKKQKNYMHQTFSRKPHPRFSYLVRQISLKKVRGRGLGKRR